LYTISSSRRGITTYPWLRREIVGVDSDNIDINAGSMRSGDWKKYRLLGDRAWGVGGVRWEQLGSDRRPDLDLH
jgi:hypothetical protein